MISEILFFGMSASVRPNVASALYAGITAMIFGDDFIPDIFLCGDAGSAKTAGVAKKHPPQRGTLLRNGSFFVKSVA